MDYALADPGSATQTGAFAVAGLSERTFRRLFLRETGTGWAGLAGQARIMGSGKSAHWGSRVTDIAADVGYASLSAFAKAFAQLIGETPAAFRRRVSK